MQDTFGLQWHNYRIILEGRTSLKNIYKKLRTIFLTSIISAAILIGAEEFIMYQLQFSIIVIGLLGGFLVGVCLSLFGWIFLRFTREVWWITIVQIFTISIASIIISFVVIFASIRFPHENWVETLPVPETIEKFIPEQNSVELRVQTKTGTIYKYECEYFSNYVDGCTWQQDNDFLQEEQEIINNPDLENYYYFSPIPPIRPVESYRAYVLYPDAIETAKFIRSEDGRIFIWHRQWDPYETIFQLFCGLIISLIVGILTNIAVFLSRKRKSAELK
jgi:hypothetical protein